MSSEDTTLCEQLATLQEKYDALLSRITELETNWEKLGELKYASLSCWHLGPPKSPDYDEPEAVDAIKQYVEEAINEHERGDYHS